MVRKLAKGILVGIAVLLAIGVVGILAINVYVESDAIRTKLEAKLTSTLRMPCRITTASFTPWRGVRITGVTIAQPARPDVGNFLEASGFTASLKMAPLLSRKLVVKELVIDEPQVVWVQNPEGNWRLPTVAKEEREQMESPAESEDEPAPTTLTGVEPGAEAPPRKPFEILVDQFSIKHGSFVFLDPDQRSIASMSDVNVESRVANSRDVQGKALCAKIAIQDVVFLANLQTPFSYIAEELALPEMSATVAGGDVRGGFTLKTTEKDSPFTCDVKFDQVDLNQVVTEAGGLPGQAAGRLSGYLDLYGRIRDAKTCVGGGRIMLAEGQLKQYEFLKMLGQAMQIEELEQLNLRQAQVDFRIGEKKVWIDELKMASPNLSLTAHGTIRFDAKIDLEARLTINERITRQLPRFIAENFHPAEDPALRYVDFEVRGTVAKPKTNLMEQIVGRKIEQQFNDLFQNIFGAKKKKEDDSKKELKAKPKLETGAPQIPALNLTPTPAPNLSPTPTPDRNLSPSSTPDAQR